MADILFKTQARVSNSILYWAEQKLVWCENTGLCDTPSAASAVV